MGRQIRNPLTFDYDIDAPIWYIPNSLQPKERATYLAQKGTNTAMILRESGRVSLAHSDQMRPRLSTAVAEITGNSGIDVNDDSVEQCAANTPEYETANHNPVDAEPPPVNDIAEKRCYQRRDSTVPKPPVNDFAAEQRYPHRSTRLDVL